MKVVEKGAFGMVAKVRVDSADCHIHFGHFPVVYIFFTLPYLFSSTCRFDFAHRPGSRTSVAERSRSSIFISFYWFRKKLSAHNPLFPSYRRLWRQKNAPGVVRKGLTGRVFKRSRTERQWGLRSLQVDCESANLFFYDSAAFRCVGCLCDFRPASF